MRRCLYQRIAGVLSRANRSSGGGIFRTVSRAGNDLPGTRGYTCARQNFATGLDIVEKTWGAESLYAFGFRQLRATANGLAGNTAGAEKELNELVTKIPNRPGSLLGVEVKVSLARVQIAAKEFRQAEANLREILPAYEAAAQQHDVRLANVRGYPGQALELLGHKRL